MSYPGKAYDEMTNQLLSPSGYENPQAKKRYHLAVIGAGPAGLVTAISAAGLGANVALIESRSMGGDCLNVGCIPSKALLEFTKNSDRSFDEAFAWLRQVRAGISEHDSVARYTDAGVDVFLGSASFNSMGKIEVLDQSIDARRIAICVGSTAAMPPIKGLSLSGALTNETVFDLQKQPESICILGAGPIGCELATVFARLGTKVHLFDSAKRPLPIELPKAGKMIEDSLLSLGVHLYFGQEIQEVSGGLKSKRVVCGSVEVESESILVALGRKANTANLHLDRVGVNTTGDGSIIVDHRLRTTNRKIFSAGDCTVESHFTHEADLQARVLVQNALFFPSASVSKSAIPHCTYTSPEVASIGPGTEEMIRKGIDFDEYAVESSQLDRARASGRVDGFAQVLTKKGSDEILSATIVGEDAGEQIALISLLMNNGMGLSHAGKGIFSYPTRSEFLRKLADAFNKTRLTPVVGVVLKRWLKWTE